VGALSVVIITRNEAARIRRCLASVAWADEVIVVDSGSTDGTEAICKEFTTRVYQRDFDTFDRQKNFGLERATGPWILSMDADEVVSPALREELKALLARDGDGRDGFLLRRENYLCRHPIRHAWGRDALVRLVRKGRGRFAGTVHEKLDVNGPVAELRQPLLHFNSDSLQEYTAKNLAYIALEAQRRYQRGERFGLARAVLSPLWVFFFRYVRLGGFRDGTMGFVLCVLLAFFTFLIHASLWELAQSEATR
jgi:glycosyltransferase involved in cell wall biosynthesis